MKTIQEGNYVLIHVNDGTARFEKVTSQLKVRFKKQIYDFSVILGKPFYSYFNLDNKNKTLIYLTEKPKEEVEDDIEQTKSTDNRELVDDGKAQTLTHQEIAKLKEENVEGEKIINAIIQGSKSFEKRTQFSKEKYLRKKKKKYMKYICIKEPTIQNISEVYFTKNIEKIGYMRQDSLTRLMSLGNIHSYHQVLVFETCSGLVTAAIMDRMGGHGRVLKGYSFAGPSEHMHAVNLMNFDEKIKKSLFHFPLDAIGKLEGKVDEARVNEEVLNYLKNGSDSLILATNEYDIPKLTSSLFPYLKLSGVFAIYSRFIQPLEITAKMLKETGEAVMIEISESWMREYQILPYRTHPLMMMSAASGYILSGIKVEKISK